MKKKILITGTFCSGKTTLYNDLKNALPDAIFIPEEAREIAELIPSVDWSQNAIRGYLIVRQIALEKIAEKDNKLIICDNGIHSNLAHDAILHPNINNYHLIDQLAHVNYDYIFFCNHTDIKIEPDGIRFVDSELRDKIANEILKYIQLINGSPIIISGNREERLNFVLRSIL